MLNDAVDQLAERVIGCAIEVHRTMGPGLLESIYHECLAMELEAQQIPFEVKRRISVDYKGRPLKAKLAGHPAGLLINFNCTTLRAGLRRLDHPTRYALENRPNDVS